MDDEAERVRALGALLREFDLDSMRLRVGETEIELIRRLPAPPPAPAGPAPPAIPAPAAAIPPAAPAATSAAPAGPPATAKRVTAPVVGVFYRSSSPGSEPFAAVGDRVAPGQVLCILEAMKLMNEITSEYAGVVSRVIPENGSLVSLGDDLFWIEP